MNYMLNKRKSKKAAGASPQTPLGELSALPQTPLLSQEGEIPLPYPPPVVNIFIRPLSQNSGSAPEMGSLSTALQVLVYVIEMDSGGEDSIVRSLWGW